MFSLKREYTEYENKSLRLPKDLIEKVQALANENQMSFNKVVMKFFAFIIALFFCLKIMKKKWKTI